MIRYQSINSDISFKKGDHIILRKRIDLNWFVGELACGRQGVFPINHVQVIVPLPQAQCKALYDFRMGPSEEEGCLTFKKGAIINVFRRVDHNWAEGRIGDVIGIFPIAFVEMNSLAKTLMEIVPQYVLIVEVRGTPTEVSSFLPHFQVTIRTINTHRSAHAAHWTNLIDWIEFYYVQSEFVSFEHKFNVKYNTQQSNEQFIIAFKCSH